MLDEVEESSFEIGRGEGRVPGVLWQLPAGADRPLVLLGHGGSGHKRSSRQVSLARRLASAGLAVAAIDGPFHGERVAQPLSAAAYQRLVVEAGVDRVLDGMNADWLAVVDVVGRISRVSTDRIGYLGLSMGTRFGLPLAAALGARLRCAVLGKFGLEQSVALDPGLHTPELMTRAASETVAPVMYHVQWDDEIFPRAGQLALFDRLGTSDKCLVAFPGPHAGTSEAAIAMWCRFLVDRLSAA